MRQSNKWKAKWMIMTVSLMVAGYLIVVESRASVESGKKALSSVQKQLIADGFDPVKIRRLYDRPQVVFEADGAILLFTYKEARVDYGQFANQWSIHKARQYLQKNEADLTRIEKEYGVDKKVITAILLVETGLGAVGRYALDLKYAFHAGSFDGQYGSKPVMGFDPGFKENFKKKIRKKSSHSLAVGLCRT